MGLFAPRGLDCGVVHRTRVAVSLDAEGQRQMKAVGQALFEHEWTPNDPLAEGDGLGPVFNAKSCVACHFQGGIGGGGECPERPQLRLALPTPPTGVREGTFTRSLRIPTCASRATPSASTPIAGARSVVDNVSCTNTFPPFDPLKTDSINSTALFGGGWIDRISDRAISHNQIRHGLGDDRSSSSSSTSTAVPPGRQRIARRRPRRQVRLEAASSRRCESSSPPRAPTNSASARR